MSSLKLPHHLALIFICLGLAFITHHSLAKKHYHRPKWDLDDDLENKKQNLNFSKNLSKDSQTGPSLSEAKKENERLKKQLTEFQKATQEQKNKEQLKQKKKTNIKDNVSINKVLKEIQTLARDHSINILSQEQKSGNLNRPYYRFALLSSYQDFYSFNRSLEAKSWYKQILKCKIESSDSHLKINMEIEI